MTIFGGWLLVPLAFALLCGGIGLLVRAALRGGVPSALVPGAGLAGLIVLAGLLTILDATAPLAAPACALAAVAGFAVARPWREERLREAGWVAACALGAFVVASLPSWLSGQWSVLGFGKLDDTAIWLGLANHVMEHGRDIAGVPPSSYQQDLVRWLDDAYPVGSFTPFGVVARLTGQDLVNAYQPVISGYVAVTATSVYACARELVGSPRRAAACGLIAVQASLFVGYAAWGSVKEICVAALLATLAATRPLALTALVAAAVVCVFGIGAAVLVAPALVAVAVLRVRRERLRETAAATAVFAAGVVPVLVVLGRSAEVTLNGSPSSDELGKLTAPLPLVQGIGLWPAGDFQVRPDPYGLAVVLAVLCAALATAALVAAVRRRDWPVPILLVTAVVGGGGALARGAPWIDAKVLAVTSALVLGAAAAGALSARRAGALGAAVLAAGSAWSWFLVNRDVQVAPRATLTEQRDIGRALAGRGPTLVLSEENLANRYLFGPAQGEGARDVRIHPIPDRNGQTGPDYATLEMGDVDPNAFADFNAIIRRRTPLGSAAPSAFRPFLSTRGYESWVRIEGAPAPVRDLPLSTSDPLFPVGLPAAPPPCGEVQALAGEQRATTLIAQPRVNPVLADPGRAQLPAGWARVAGGIAPGTDGAVTLKLTLPAAGSWSAWVQGSTLGRLTVAIDGRELSSLRHEIAREVAWLPFGARRLAAGEHTLTLRYSRGPFWRAGRGTAAAQKPLGLVALAPEGLPEQVRVPVGKADTLCDGRSFDWVEALPG